MKIGIISLVSDVHDPATVSRASDSILSQLKQQFHLEDIEERAIKDVEFPVVLIKTGGTEHRFKKLAHLFEESGKPVTLLATGSNNSLPAAMEILSWLNQKGFKNNLLLHGSIQLLERNIRKRAADIEILNTFTQTRIGAVGKPSDWLIASAVDYEKVKQRWGVTIQDISLEEVIENAAKVSEKDAAEVLPTLPLAQYKREVTPKDMVDAAKIYLAMKKVISDYLLTTLTLRCFDLLKPLGTTGCLALSRLNDEGIVAGCEGDMPALFTMLVDRCITGKPAFMANPSQIDIEKRKLTVAHCAVPMSIVQSFGIRTHFESGIGVGIAGKFSEETPMTVSKIGGTQLDRFYVSEGNIVTHRQSEELCRTQLTLKMEKGMDYFLNDPLGNHHIFSTGKHARRFKEVMALVGAVQVSG